MGVYVSDATGNHQLLNSNVKDSVGNFIFQLTLRNMAEELIKTEIDDN